MHKVSVYVCVSIRGNTIGERYKIECARTRVCAVHTSRFVNVFFLFFFYFIEFRGSLGTAVYVSSFIHIIYDIRMRVYKIYYIERSKSFSVLIARRYINTR
jgi:hypothetical protein